MALLAAHSLVRFWAVDKKRWTHRIAPWVKETFALFGRKLCYVRQNLPIEKLMNLPRQVETSLQSCPRNRQPTVMISSWRMRRPCYRSWLSKNEPGPMNLNIAALLLQDGLTNGAIYALLALAAVMVFAVTRVIMIPQGELVPSYGALTFANFQVGKVPATVGLVLLFGIACASL